MPRKKVSKFMTKKQKKELLMAVKRTLSLWKEVKRSGTKDTWKGWSSVKKIPPAPWSPRTINYFFKGKRILNGCFLCEIIKEACVFCPLFINKLMCADTDHPYEKWTCSEIEEEKAFYAQQIVDVLENYNLSKE